MFQTHCYDSWLSPGARKTTFFMYSQLLGTLPAPLFLFLAGMSFALVTEKLRAKQVVGSQIARSTIRRGAEIFALGLLFRLQQFAFNWRWAPWSDLLRVDILNTIGVSMMLMGLLCWGSAAVLGGGPSPRNRISLRTATVLAAIAAALTISLATPPLWTTHRVRFLPWPLESYINGVHTFGDPKGWFFPVFPWAGFAFAGLAVGFLLWSERVRRREGIVFAAFGVLGVALILLGRWLDRLPQQFYAVYSFWTTSPEFFLIRVGLLLVLMFIVYAWCRWGAAQWGFSPLIQFGQTSLLVYWVHIEFVYDRFMILPRHANSIRMASYGVAFIMVFMLVLSMLRTQLKGRGQELRARLRSVLRPAPAA